MKVAALYDIHGNLPALRAVLDDLADVNPTMLVIGGDVVSGPLPEQTLDAIFASGYIMRWVMGNADRNVVEADGPVSAWSADHLRPEQLMLLETFSPTVTTAGTVFCHGSPRSDTERLTTATPDERLADACAGVRHRTVVCGHTHRQFDRMLGDQRVVNAGSVGLPWEGRAGAYWLLLEDGEPHLRHTPYDVEAAVEDLREGGAPWVDDLLRDSLTDPVDPDRKSAEIEASAD